MASFISGECRHLRETHGNIKAVPPGSRMHPSVHRLSVMGGKADIAWTCRHVCLGPIADIGRPLSDVCINSYPTSSTVLV
jgi:hypothetical protein